MLRKRRLLDRRTRGLIAVALLLTRSAFVARAVADLGWRRERAVAGGCGDRLGGAIDVGARERILSGAANRAGTSPSR
jgi:hypothetical protein